MPAEVSCAPRMKLNQPIPTVSDHDTLTSTCTSGQRPHLPTSVADQSFESRYQLGARLSFESLRVPDDRYENPLRCLRTQTRTACGQRGSNSPRSNAQADADTDRNRRADARPVEVVGVDGVLAEAPRSRLGVRRFPAQRILFAVTTGIATELDSS